MPIAPRPVTLLALAAALPLTAPDASSQEVTVVDSLRGCRPQRAIEFMAPMPGEEIPNFHVASPNPDSWTVVLELSLDHGSIVAGRVFEAAFVPAPGAAVPLPTDVNGDGIQGDPHPAIPALRVVLDDDLFLGGMPIPAGTNVASLFELLGSELEHGGDQTTTITWILDPNYFLADINGDLGTNLAATFRSATDTVFVRHGLDLSYQGFFSVQNPTLSISTTDWLSTVDSDSQADNRTPFLVCVEARIPCFFDNSTNPPTPVPLDPIFGPCWGGAVACTGNFPPMPGPGFNPFYPSLDVRFSDDYIDGTTGSFVPGGVITGGQCGVIWGSTGGSLGFAFRQSSVHAWYGVNGVPDTTPLGGGDDQLIYRFTMIADGMIFDTDNLPGEMMITAAIETTSNCFSITNVRVNHRPDVETPDPLP